MTKPSNGSVARIAVPCCNNLVTIYQISTAPGKVVPGTMDEPLA